MSIRRQANLGLVNGCVAHLFSPLLSISISYVYFQSYFLCPLFFLHSPVLHCVLNQNIRMAIPSSQLPYLRPSWHNSNDFQGTSHLYWAKQQTAWGDLVDHFWDGLNISPTGSAWWLLAALMRCSPKFNFCAALASLLRYTEPAGKLLWLVTFIFNLLHLLFGKHQPHSAAFTQYTFLGLLFSIL